MPLHPVQTEDLEGTQEYRCPENAKMPRTEVPAGLDNRWIDWGFQSLDLSTKVLPKSLVVLAIMLHDSVWNSSFRLTGRWQSKANNWPFAASKEQIPHHKPLRKLTFWRDGHMHLLTYSWGTQPHSTEMCGVLFYAVPYHYLNSPSKEGGKTIWKETASVIHGTNSNYGNILN